MGALITMRDDPHDAAIPQQLVADTKYHDKRIAEAEATIAVLADLTPEAAEAEWRTVNANIEATNAETVRRNDETRQRYDAMLAQLHRHKDGWPEGLYSLMADQLHSSRDFDVDEDPLRWAQEPYASPEEWRMRVTKNALETIAYHTRERDKAIARTAERNAWLAQLWAALPPEETETK